MSALLKLLCLSGLLIGLILQRREISRLQAEQWQWRVCQQEISEKNLIITNQDQEISTVTEKLNVVLDDLRRLLKAKGCPEW